MVLRFPREVVLETYLGRWVNLAALPEGRRLRQTDPLTNTWGSPTEQSGALAPPSTVDGVLNNVGGHWTPGNPMSDYFRYLQGRNAPTRFGLVASRDAFARTSAFDWGFSEVGDGWATASSGTGGATVGGGVGVHSQPNASAYVITYLTDSYPDCQAAITCTATNVSDVTGGPIEPANLVLRYQPGGAFAGEHYLLRVSVDTSEVMTLTIHHATLGGSSAISSTANFGAVSPSAPGFRVKFQVEGQTLRGKLYAAGPSNDPDANEPLGWHVEAHHERLTGGQAGVRSGVGAGNSNAKPITFSMDDWSLVLMQHCGELAKLDPSWDLSHRIKRAAFRAADITQRLGRTNRASLTSAPRRYIPTTNPVAYWPCDEGVLANAFTPLVGRQAIRLSQLSAGNGAQVSTTPMAPWIGTGVTVPAGSALICPVEGSSATSWGVDMLLTPGTGAGAMPSPFAVTTDQSIWEVTLDYATNTVSMLLNPSGGAQVLLGTGTLPAASHGPTRWVRFTTEQSGGNVVWLVWVDYTLVTSGIRVGFTNTAMTQVRLFTQNQDATFAHVTAYNGTGADPVATFYAARGYIGEKGLDRAIRLCAEEGVPLDYWGPPADTRPMGPQHPAPLLDLVVECAETDGAFVYGPRYTPGLAFRPRRAMVARAADATLSYSGNMVAPPFGMSADDRPVANLVRAERIDGGGTVVEQTSGPMNTNDPGTDVEAAGTVPASARVRCESDAQLPDVGGWVRALGTVPEVRFPRVSVDLRAPAMNTGPGPAAGRALLTAHPGDRLAVTGMTAADVYRDLDQIVRGGQYVLRDAYQHDLALNTAPYEKYRAGIYGDATSRYDGAVTTLDAQLSSGVTGGRAVTTSSGPQWTVDAGAYPLAVLIGGELCTVSGVTGAGAAQTMTISARNVNGLPTAGGLTHPAGTSVVLAQPCYYC